MSTCTGINQPGENYSGPRSDWVQAVVGVDPGGRGLGVESGRGWGSRIYRLEE